MVVTTPDYTLTPTGAALYGEPEVKSAMIREFNGCCTAAAAARGIAVVDVSPISDRVAELPSLVADDGVHPSGKQYAGWADLVAERVRRLFRRCTAASDIAWQDRPIGFGVTMTPTRCWPAQAGCLGEEVARWQC